MDRIIIDPRDDICSSCCVKYKHRISFIITENEAEYVSQLGKGIKLIHLNTMCAICRDLFNQKAQLQAKLNNIDFILYCRQYPLIDNSEY